MLPYNIIVDYKKHNMFLSTYHSWHTLLGVCDIVWHAITSGQSWVESVSMKLISGSLACCSLLQDLLEFKHAKHNCVVWQLHETEIVCEGTCYMLWKQNV